MSGERVKLLSLEELNVEVLISDDPMFTQTFVTARQLAKWLAIIGGPGPSQMAGRDKSEEWEKAMRACLRWMGGEDVDVQL